MYKAKTLNKKNDWQIEVYTKTIGSKVSMWKEIQNFALNAQFLGNDVTRIFMEVIYCKKDAEKTIFI